MTDRESEWIYCPVCQDSLPFEWWKGYGNVGFCVMCRTVRTIDREEWKNFRREVPED